MTRHPAHCYDDDGKLDCAGCPADDPGPESTVEFFDFYDPDDVEPCGGDPWWREREL